MFDFVKKETWYVPNLSLYNDMIRMVGKHRMIEMVEQFVVELQNEGLQPDARTYTELIGAYFKVEMVNKAMETYDQMKASGYVPDKLTLTILIRNLEKAGENALSEAIRKECAEYFDYPNKFLEEVERKHVSIHYLQSLSPFVGGVICFYMISLTLYMFLIIEVQHAIVEFCH